MTRDSSPKSMLLSRPCFTSPWAAAHGSIQRETRGLSSSTFLLTTQHAQTGARRRPQSQARPQAAATMSDVQPLPPRYVTSCAPLCSLERKEAESQTDDQGLDKDGPAALVRSALLPSFLGGLCSEHSHLRQASFTSSSHMPLPPFLPHPFLFLPSKITVC